MAPPLCIEDIHEEAVKKLKKSYTGTTHCIYALSYAISQG